MPDKLVLVSRDGRNFEVNKTVAYYCLTIKTMLELLGDDGKPIDLSMVRGEMLERIIAWIQHHIMDENLAKCPCDENLASDEDTVCGWDKQFLKLSIGALHELAESADYLGVEELRERCLDAIYILETE